jgi:hypothetical protein
MQTRDPEETRVETLTAALLFLMTQYARTRCPKLAVCVSRHMQCLALHPDAPNVVRDVCASLHGPWADAAGQGDDSDTRPPLH